MGVWVYGCGRRSSYTHTPIHPPIHTLCILAPSAACEQHVPELHAALADEPRVALHHHALEWSRQVGNLGILRWWDGARVEEAAGVVELQAAARALHGRQALQGIAD